MAKCDSGLDGCWISDGWWLFQHSSGFQWYRGILPDVESKQRWGNHIFSARLLCAQEIQRVAFILQSGANVALFCVS